MLNLGYFFLLISLYKTYAVSTETLLISTHNICFYGELVTIIPELSPNTRQGASNSTHNICFVVVVFHGELYKIIPG